jgi:phosphatidate cytidylyltransferase
MIALPLLILFILKTGRTPFSFLILVLAFIGLLEFYRMAFPERKTEGLLAAAVGAPIVLANGCEHLPVSLVLTFLVLFFALSSLVRIRDIRNSAAEAALFLLGILYVPLLISYLVMLRGLPLGISWIFLLLIIVMSGDTAAFYVGSTLGKRRLYPLVSPKKSVEGMFGGLAGSVIGTFLARAAFFPELSAVDCVVTALLVGLVGQLGDLFESLLKRSFGVKDSGNIFPGHGGMLDRLDSVLFAAPTLYVYARYCF